MPWPAQAWPPAPPGTERPTRGVAERRAARYWCLSPESRALSGSPRPPRNSPGKRRSARSRRADSSMNITAATTFSNGEVPTGKPNPRVGIAYRDLGAWHGSVRSWRRCGQSSGTSAADRSSATVKSLGAPDIRAQPGRSATSLPTALACPGGGWYGRTGSWPPTAGRSRPGDCVGKASPSETGAASHLGIRKVGQLSACLNAG